MSDYIKRDDAIAACEDGVFIPMDYKAFFIEALNEIPAADVRKNKKGTWIKVDGHWKCSLCRHPRFHDLTLGVDASFCGCCGAAMR